MGARNTDLADLCPILFGSRWPAGDIDEAIAAVDAGALSAEYMVLRENAPRRAQSGKSYFVGHTRVASAAGASNKLEEHCAIALVNLGRRWPRPKGGWLRLIDYQVPLKTRQADTGIGKLDLLGVTDQGRLVVVELKVEGQSGGRGDAPPAALMEGLRYAAMVEADLEAITREAERRFGMKVARMPPIVQLLAPEAWWRRWTDLPGAGNWGQPFVRLAAAVEAGTGVAIECMALENVKVSYGLDGHAPRLDAIPALRAVSLDKNPPIGEPLRRPSPDATAPARYLDAVGKTLWAWADQHHRDQLDDGRRRRPPVLKRTFAEMNILVPPDKSIADDVRAAIPAKQRHRYFASLRSSQALTQSVFGAIAASGRLDVLNDTTAECGRPAFFTDHRGWRLSFEHEVNTLGEPRPTSIDVLLSGRDGSVAVECKFTEAEFGTCSRPRLRPGDASYSEQRCDGDYRVQAGRGVRCALTTIGVRYWEYLPRLFAWQADRDHAPCPFGAVYQLARNVLSAAITPDGEIDPARGHALVLYDARNPAFQAGGNADNQWEAAVAASLMPGLLRRVSWQRVVAYIAMAPKLTWLVDALREKYGIVPD